MNSLFRRGFDTAGKVIHRTPPLGIQRLSCLPVTCPRGLTQQRLRRLFGRNFHFNFSKLRPSLTVANFISAQNGMGRESQSDNLALLSRSIHHRARLAPSRRPTLVSE